MRRPTGSRHLAGQVAGGCGRNGSVDRREPVELIWASTPDAVRMSNAMSSRSADRVESCGCTSIISEPVNQRIKNRYRAPRDR